VKKPRFQPRGLATGIGSLPHRDPSRAVEAILRHVPRCPFWPQLPRRSPLEGMTLQYLEGMPCLREQAGGDPVADPGAVDELAGYYETLLGSGVEPFALSRDRAPGFYAFEDALVQLPPGTVEYLKAHVTGPVTLTTSLKDAAGREVLHDDSLRGAVASLLAAKAQWQVRRLQRFGVPVIVFLDEPVMEVYGSAYSTLSRELVMELWQPVLEGIAGAGALSGIHCCGNTDWGLLFESGTDIVNFDACHFLEKMLLYPDQAGPFLEGGGAIAWGAVPTSEEARDCDAAGLGAALDTGLRRFAAAGLDEALLRRQCLITPSCGMGSLDEALSEHILRLLGGVSVRFGG
jgi:hypothetical protein